MFEKSFSFNTLIASIMEAINALDKQRSEEVWREGLYILLNLLEPITPHIANEMSQELFDRENLKAKLEMVDEVFEYDSVTYAVTINGKKRGEIEVQKDSAEIEIVKRAKDAVSKWLEESDVVREIVVPNRLVNLVIKQKKG